jgi:hypothetical protein
MNTNEFLMFARQCMDDHGLHNLDLALDKGLKRLGGCHYKRIDGKMQPVKITFSRAYIEKGNQEQILNTVLHEIAHALVPYSVNHGPVWVDKCKEIGYTNPRVCQDAGMRKTFKAVCYKCGDLPGFRKGYRKPSSRGLVHSCLSSIKWEEVN